MSKSLRLWATVMEGSKPARVEVALPERLLELYVTPDGAEPGNRFDLVVEIGPTRGSIQIRSRDSQLTILPKTSNVAVIRPVRYEGEVIDGE